MKPLTDFCTFGFLPWADYSHTDFLVCLDASEGDRLRVYRPRDRVPEEIWVYLDGARIAVVTNSSPVSLVRDTLAPWASQAEADELIALMREAFGIA